MLLSPYGYVYMPNTFWSLPQKRPRVCTDSAQKGAPCSVCPTYTSGVPHDALQYSKQWEPKRADPSQSRPNPQYYYPGYYAAKVPAAPSPL